MHISFRLRVVGRFERATCKSIRTVLYVRIVYTHSISMGTRPAKPDAGLIALRHSSPKTASGLTAIVRSSRTTNHRQIVHSFRTVGSQLQSQHTNTDTHTHNYPRLDRSARTVHASSRSARKLHRIATNTFRVRVRPS